ncbi:MAG TPA: hypothetical protein VK963_04145, partial [Candidatus Saccharimonadales bacterium]|nr:hypothetical protein [Candidatus Saccharimonadales bacterium]
MDPQSDKPELAWSLSDYQAHEQEAPDRLHDQPLACECELMTEDEIEQYCRYGIATLMILRDN